MGFKELFAVLLVVGCTNAQISRVCVPSSDSVRCQNMNRDGSQVACELTDTRVECASKLSRNAADVGMFSEEELLLLAQMPSNTDLRVVASIRDANRQEEVAFESVVVVASNHAGGFEGLRGGRYCHPGFGVADVRWSPRVLRAFEVAAARTDRCEGDTGRRTSEELEVEALNNFFSAACRPGPWSANATLDIMLKSSFPNLCSLCTAPGTCAGYSTSMAINIGNVQNSNRHIQALECLRTNGTVAYVAWQHVREYFTIRNPDAMTSFSLLCENGTLAALTPESLSSPSSPCALVRQPWRAIVTTAARAESLAGNLRTWWPQAADPGGNTWESSLFGVLAGGSNARVFFEETPVTPLDYTSRFRTIPSIDSTASCLPARRWCTLSAAEQNKCNWIRTAAYSLGLQPAISCQQRANEFDCLRDIQESRVDFFSLDSHYGYLARRRYRLSPVKMVQNIRGSTSRLAALVKESSIGNITRFGNLKDGVACFPEYGSLAYVAFLRTAHQRGVISATECNYARAVGEFFSSACAPGATSSSHTIVDNSDFTPDVLCTACRVAGAPIDASSSNFTCAYNWTNAFYGNNGSLNCLAAPHTDVAFVEVQNIRAQMAALNLNHSNFRMLCQNDSLAINAGLDDISEDCLLTDVVDAEVLTRRNDAIWNSLNTFLDALDDQFGYNAPAAEQLINFHLYSSFDGNNDLLFKDSTIGLTEPTTEAPHGPARNYIDLFTHLESCTSSAPPPLQPGVGQPGHATRNLVSVVTMTLMGLLARFVVY